MTRKPMSWAQTGLLFLWMAACTFGLTIAFYPSLRNQVGSIHSTLWQIALPSDLAAISIFAVAARFIVNWSSTRQNRPNLETHQSS
jgi:drug/metabolite transporter (DMT)-like permease